MGRVSRRATSLDLGEKYARTLWNGQEEKEKRRKEKEVTKVLT